MQVLIKQYKNDKRIPFVSFKNTSKFFLLVFIFFSFSVNSQTKKASKNRVTTQNIIRIKFFDSIKNKNFYGIQVQLKNSSNQIIRQGLTDKNGEINFLNLPINHTFILNYSGLGYKNKTVIKIKTGKKIQFIKLETYNYQLDEVIIRSKKERFTVHGDTISYNANRYKSDTDENVGNIIEKLPGVLLTDGNLMIEGDKVNNILLDGKTYIKANVSATLNQIPSDIIYRIEVIDNVSPDDAAVQLKTINIVTKPKDVLTFGKIVTNYGSNERNRLAGNYYFKTKHNRLTTIADANNINKEDLLANDLSELFEGTNSLLASGLNYQYESDDENTALEFNLISNSLKRNQNQLYNQYLLGAIDEGPILNTTNTVNINESVFSYDLLFSNDFNSNYSLIIESVGNNLTSLNNNLYTDQRFLKSVNIYDLSSTTNSEQKTLNLDNSINIIKRFNRTSDKLIKNREISLLYRYNLREDSTIDSLSYNYSDVPSLNLWQIRNASVPIKTSSGTIGVTENWGDNYVVNYSISANRVTVNNEILTSKFDDENYTSGELVAPLSSINEIKQQNQEASIKLYRNKGKTQTTVGLEYKNLIIFGDLIYPFQEKFKSNYPAILPIASFVFNNKNMTRFKIAYKSLQEAPLFRHLNPILDNIIPSRPFLGQPDLEPEIKHVFDIEFKHQGGYNIQHIFRFNTTKTNNFIGENIYLPTKDSIVNGFSIKQGTQLLKPSNFKHQISSNFSMNHERNTEKFKYGINYGFRKDVFPSRQNNRNAETKIKRFNSGVYWNYYPNKVLSFNFNYFASYAEIENSLSPENKQSVINWNSRLNIRYLLFNSLLLNFDATSFQVDANNSQNVNNNINSILNFNAKYALLKKQRFSLLFTMHDILNQNKDITQNPTALYFTQEQKTMLGRYILLGFSLDI